MSLPPDVIRSITGFIDDTSNIVKVLRGVCKHWKLALSISALKCNEGLDIIDIKKYVEESFFGLRTKFLTIRGWEITYSVLNALKHGLPNLKILHVHTTLPPTDEFILNVAQKCPLLTELDLRWCETITDISMVALARGCPGLTCLKMAGCRNLTDTSMVAIAHGCPNLTTLRIWECPKITDLSIVEIAHGCPNIMMIDIGLCWMLTDASVLVLENECPSLTKLCFYGCDNMTYTSTDRIYAKLYKARVS
jgi:hypothetical protein